MILHSKPWLIAEDLDAVAAVLRSGMLGQGERVEILEHEMASWIGASHGVAVGSGSAALLLALRALGIGVDDEVLLPTYVCVSVMEAIIAAGAKPRFSDVGRQWVLTPDNVAAAITRRTKALVVPHLYGIDANVAAFARFGVAVIEDCAQAVAARGERPLSGDVAVFSFHPTKCLTSGEGGMLVTNDPHVARRARLIRDGSGPPARELFSPLSDMSAALALSQLARYHVALWIRRQIAQQYLTAIGDGISLSDRLTLENRSTLFRFVLRVADFEEVERAFGNEGILVRRGVDRLVHCLAGLGDSAFPQAKELLRTTVSLPIYPALTADERARCSGAAARILRRQAAAPM